MGVGPEIASPIHALLAVPTLSRRLPDIKPDIKWAASTQTRRCITLSGRASTVPLGAACRKSAKDRWQAETAWNPRFFESWSPAGCRGVWNRGAVWRVIWTPPGFAFTVYAFPV